MGGVGVFVMSKIISALGFLAAILLSAVALAVAVAAVRFQRRCWLMPNRISFWMAKLSFRLVFPLLGREDWAPASCRLFSRLRRRGIGHQRNRHRVLLFGRIAPTARTAVVLVAEPRFQDTWMSARSSLQLRWRG
jgi:hypothetical protein